MRMSEITELLDGVSKGDAEATERLLPLVYNELRQLAHRQLRKERHDHTINTTALVHELYLKMVEHPMKLDWESRSHFFAVAARAMRQILVNYAKSRSRKKRGGGVPNVSLDEAVIMPEERAEELIALDEALEQLAKMNERQAKVVECRYFSGLTIEETASVLGVSVPTVNRDWTTAKLWLYIEVKQALGQA